MGDEESDEERGYPKLWTDDALESFLLFVEQESVALIRTKEVANKGRTNEVAISEAKKVASLEQVEEEEMVVSRAKEMASFEEVAILKAKEEKTPTMTENKKCVVDVSKQVVNKRSRLLSQYVVFFLYN